MNLPPNFNNSDVFRKNTIFAAKLRIFEENLFLLIGQLGRSGEGSVEWPLKCCTMKKNPAGFRVNSVENYEGSENL